MERLKSEFHKQLNRWKSEPPSPAWKPLVAILGGSILLVPLVHRLPMLGYDWRTQFYIGRLAMYPPWMLPVLEPLRWFPWRWSLAILNSLTLVGIAVITACQARRIRWDGLISVLAVLLSPPLWYVLWGGQIDVLVLIGLLALPWSIPLVLLRPQIMGWLVASRRQWSLGLVLFLGLSLLLWGWWPPGTFGHVQHSLLHPTAMGWVVLGWPILIVGLFMMWRAEGDWLRFLAGALLASPYTQPYHMVILLPAMGRVTGYRRLVVYAWVWVVGMVPGLMGFSRYLALGFPITVWWLLRHHPQSSWFAASEYPAHAA